MEIETVLQFLLHGMVSPTPLFLTLFTIATSFATLLAVTCFLHRSQTHRSIAFIAPVNHVFRLVLWFFTSINTKEWVSIHRKHHAFTDTEKDPHSPRYFGLKKILLEGADIYRHTAAHDPKILEEFGEGTPDDWMERNIYVHKDLGIYMLLAIELILFGLPALIIWPIHMLVIPTIAAGFINGIGHAWGYKRYRDGEPKGNGKVFERIGDSLNIPTYGLAVGEEFHNNHHAFQDRYKFSHAWYEFDLGGTVIELMTFVGLARVPKRN